MRNFIFVKYKPKLSMQWLENNYKKYQNYPFRNPYNNTMITQTLQERTNMFPIITMKTFQLPTDLEDISYEVSSMRSLNFSSYRPLQ